MEKLLGLLRVHVKKGINLAIRDVMSSDPYVKLKVGKQRFKTHVVDKNVNPEWNEELTLSITDPNASIRVTVYDYDVFSMDDKMGDAEFDIKDYIEALKMDCLGDLPKDTVIARVQPSRSNCLSEESKIIWTGDKIIQDLTLRLRNVECGEVVLSLSWIDLPGSKGLKS